MTVADVAVSLPPVRILHLEDSDSDAELVAAQLDALAIPYVTRRAVDRASFVAALEAGGHDLVLADFHLPSFDGAEALAMTRAAAPDVPFIFVSGVIGEDAAVEALKQGAIDYVVKHRLAKLPLAVSRALREAAAQAERDRIAAELQSSYAALQASEARLQRLNATLEDHVVNRTRALAATNAELLRQIAVRERTETALRHAQKMEAVGQLTGGVAHDFNNLLTLVIGGLDLIERALPKLPGGAPAERIRSAVGMAMQGARRAATLTHRLLAFSRRQALDPQPVQANRLVGEMAGLLRSTLGETIVLETRLEPQLWMTRADPNQLESALLNLAINARDAMPQGGRLTVRTENRFLAAAAIAADDDGLEPGEFVMLSVSDTGTGMSEEVRRRAFDPFFTTKDVGHGTGLGLSQIYGFVRQSGGVVRLESTPGQGTDVQIWLPRTHAEADAAPASAPASVPAGEDEWVLVVEDNEAVRDYSTTLLQELGYRVVEAASAAAALEVIDRQPMLRLLFTDIGLPGGMSGRQLADAARALRPGLRVLCTTGYAQDMGHRKDRADDAAPGVSVIAKPFTMAELATRLREVLDTG